MLCVLSNGEELHHAVGGEGHKGLHGAATILGHGPQGLCGPELTAKETNRQNNFSP